MIQKSIKIDFLAHSRSYTIAIGNNLLNHSGEWAQNSLAKPTKKITIVSNAKVFRLYGKIVQKSLENQGFEVYVFLMKDGEQFKNLKTLEKLLEFLSRNKLTRNDASIALGGGVVGDLTGFASAIYLRGISFLQIPTTLLSMIDSSVGGKTGVNSAFGKNLVGAFHQPAGVLIDSNTLKTLDTRDLTAGFCEAIKHGTISSGNLFSQTADFLRNFPLANFTNYFTDEEFYENLENLLMAQIACKAAIVAQDEREDIFRTDSKSRKILNFGHTVGHALEKVTDYKYFKHGEAVGYGILCAAEISKNIGIFDKFELKSLNDVVRSVGKLPAANNIQIEKLIEAFAYDKKVNGKNLQWVLLKKIGEPVIFEDTKIPDRILRNSLQTILKG